MAKNDLLKKLNRALNGQTVDFSSFDAEVMKLKQKLQEDVNIQTVDDVKRQINLFQKKIDFTPILVEMEKIRGGVETKRADLETKIKDISGELDAENEAKNVSRVTELQKQLDSLKGTLTSLSNSRLENLKSLANQLSNLQNSSIESLANAIKPLASKKDTEQLIKDTQEIIDKVRTELLSKMSHLGGGSMNRQIFVGNSDALSRYSDIAIKAGSNMTITFANNNTTKKSEITFASSGGGGGGTVRSINSISVDTSAGATSGTDYVYLCSGTLALTLPDASTNTNLYTVKNVGTGVVTINTTSSQTIDGALTIVMPVQYTAVDLISDTSNWNIT